MVGVAGALGIRVVAPVMEGHSNDNDNVPTHHHPVGEQHVLEQQQNFKTVILQVANEVRSLIVYLIGSIVFVGIFLHMLNSVHNR